MSPVYVGLLGRTHYREMGVILNNVQKQSLNAWELANHS